MTQTQHKLSIPSVVSPSKELYPASISIVDGYYYHAERSGAYLIVEGSEAAFIDNVTRFSVPHLMAAVAAQGLTPEQVRYLIVTHVHLDHSGGTAELAKNCPNATILCHPRAARHIIDPERLVSSAKSVYGEAEFMRLFGEIEPVEEKRVQIVQDSETIGLGSRTLTFMDSPGHARHHHAIYDSGTNSVFAGDVFGTNYRQLQGGKRPYFTYVCSPPEFDPVAARTSIRRVLDTGADRVFVSHYGASTELKAGAEVLFRVLEAQDELTNRVAKSELGDESMLTYCLDETWQIIKRELEIAGLDPNNAGIREWATKEHMVSAQGIEVLAKKRRKEGAGG